MRDKVALRPLWDWPPLSGRLPQSSAPAILAEIEERLTRAITIGQPSYFDAATGLTVFTARFLAERNYCCDSGCRHCPYEPSDEHESASNHADER